MASAKNIILNIFTFLLVAILAASTVYFYLKSQEKTPIQKSIEKTNQTTETNTLPTPSSKLPATPTTNSQLPTTTKPAAPTNRPSNPAHTYTIGSGETLSTISTKLNMNWTRLLEVNNLENGDKIKEGQVILVPSYDETTKKLYVEFTPDTQKATQLQEQAATTPTSPYLDPAATAKLDAIGIYGLAETDTYTFVSKNELDGTAIVDVAHLDKKYIINLTQPVKKTKDGIWAISKIIPS